MSGMVTESDEEHADLAPNEDEWDWDGRGDEAVQSRAKRQRRHPFAAGGGAHQRGQPQKYCLDEDEKLARTLQDRPPPREASRRGKGFYAEPSIVGSSTQPHHINNFFEETGEVRQEKGKEKAATAAAAAASEGFKGNTMYKSKENADGMIEIHVTVDEKTPMKDRLPLLEPYRAPPPRTLSQEVIEMVHEKGTPPQPVSIKEITRRDYAPVSLATTNVMERFEKVVRKATYDKLEFERAHPKTGELKSAKCIVERMAKPKSGFGEEVCRALRGACHPDVELRRIVDPDDVVFQHQHVEGGGVYGVYARAPIKAGTVLGQYTGLNKVDRQNNEGVEDDDDECGPQEDHNGRKVTAPPAKYGHAWGSGGRKGEQGGSSLGADALVSPAVFSQEHGEGSQEDKETDSLYAITLPTNCRNESLRLYCDSKYHANEMSYINDCRKTGHHTNCEYVGGLCNDWPFVVVVTSEDIKADEQIYVDYGEESYWQPHEVARQKMIDDKKRELDQGRAVKEEEQKKRAATGVVVFTGEVNDSLWPPTQPGPREQDVAFVEMTAEKISDHCDWLESSATVAREGGYPTSERFPQHLESVRNTEGGDGRVKGLLRASRELSKVLQKWLEGAEEDFQKISKERMWTMEMSAKGSEKIADKTVALITMMRGREERLQELGRTNRVFWGGDDAEHLKEDIEVNRWKLELLRPNDPDYVENIISIAEEHQGKLELLENKAKELKEEVLKEKEAVHKVIQACIAASAKGK